MATSIEWAGQVRIKSWSDEFWQSYGPLTLKKREGIFSFRLLSPQQLYIFNSNLRYGYVIHFHKNTLVKFEFGHGLVIAELSLLKFEKNQKFLVFDHFLNNRCTHSTQI
jgi:hypothetical protein